MMLYADTFVTGVVRVSSMILTFFSYANARTYIHPFSLFMRYVYFHAWRVMRYSGFDEL